MSSGYKCGTCGVVSDERDHLCQPEEMASRAEYCGSGPEHINQLCDEVDSRLTHQCFTCGRPTDKPDMVCNPSPIREFGRGGNF